MQITLIYKWAHEEDDALVNPDGTFKWRRDKLVASDDDAAAMASARALAQATDSEIAGVTLGNGDASWLLARGAVRVVNADGLDFTADEAVMASRLAAVARLAGDADLVVMGDARELACVAGAVAAELGLPYVGGVGDFEADPADPGKLIAHRVTDDGVQTLSVKLPALVSVAAVDSEKNVPSMKEMLAAKKLPQEKVQVACADDPKLQPQALRLPEARMAELFDDAASLVAKLKQDSIL